MRLQIPFSVLDLSNMRLGETPHEAFRQTIDLARRVEALGFKRFWLAEHHGVLNSASAATSVLIGHVAGKPSAIRVGSGAVMLPNQPPLVIAEQFGTLASLYPDRIDLRLDRVAGGHDGVLQALRVGPDARDPFPSDVRELQFCFREPTPDQNIHTMPRASMSGPIWLLGSLTFSAEQAGAPGLPFAFATHIGPNAVGAALEIYRLSFKASEVPVQPHVMITVLVVAAETDEAARHLFISIQQIVLTTLRGEKASPMPRPVQDISAITTAEELAGAARSLRDAIVDSRKTMRQRIEALIAETAADELSVFTMIYDLDARRRPFRARSRSLRLSPPTQLNSSRSSRRRRRRWRHRTSATCAGRRGDRTASMSVHGARQQQIL
jgi:luciferase family oxidoreductase group 1